MDSAATLGQDWRTGGLTMATDLAPVAFVVGEGNDAGTAIVKCTDNEGREYAVKLDTMSMQTMASFLAQALLKVADQSPQMHRVAPNVDRISLELGTKWGTEILRLYVTPQVYHEYSVASDTNLGRQFRDLGRLIDEYQTERSSPSTGLQH